MPRKISIKGLQRAIEKKTKEHLIKIRGNKCELCGQLATEADHCFTRKVRQLFTSPSNLTLVCKSCHFKKTYHQNAYDIKVYDHVKKREGEKKFNQMRKIAEQHKPFPNWSNRIWLEKKLKELQNG